MESIEKLPPVQWALTHPRLAAWIVLSVGMVGLLINEARDVGLTTGNWIALIIATVLVAGACILIVSWEDVDESEVPIHISTQETPAVETESSEEVAE